MEERRILDCRNDDDPFTMESLANLDSKQIIKIDGYCFDLKAIYNWVHNLRRNDGSYNNNPLTNLPFSIDDINMIKREAARNFPLVIQNIFREERYVSRGLTIFMSWLKIFTFLIGHVTRNNPDPSIYEAIKFISQSLDNDAPISIQIKNNNGYTLFSEVLKRDIIYDDEKTYPSNPLIIEFNVEVSDEDLRKDIQNYKDILIYNDIPVGNLFIIIPRSVQVPAQGPRRIDKIEINVVMEISFLNTGLFQDLFSQTEELEVSVLPREISRISHLKAELLIKIRKDKTVKDLIILMRPYLERLKLPGMNLETMLVRAYDNRLITQGYEISIASRMERFDDGVSVRFFEPDAYLILYAGARPEHVENAADVFNNRIIPILEDDNRNVPNRNYYTMTGPSIVRNFENETIEYRIARRVTGLNIPTASEDYYPYWYKVVPEGNQGFSPWEFEYASVNFIVNEFYENRHRGIAELVDIFRNDPNFLRFRDRLALAINSDPRVNINNNNVL